MVDVGTHRQVYDVLNSSVIISFLFGEHFPQHQALLCTYLDSASLFFIPTAKAFILAFIVCDLSLSSLESYLCSL